MIVAALGLAACGGASTGTVASAGSAGASASSAGPSGTPSSSATAVGEIGADVVTAVATALNLDAGRVGVAVKALSGRYPTVPADALGTQLKDYAENAFSATTGSAQAVAEPARQPWPQLCSDLTAALASTTSKDLLDRAKAHQGALESRFPVSKAGPPAAGDSAAVLAAKRETLTMQLMWSSLGMALLEKDASTADVEATAVLLKEQALVCPRQG